MSADTGAVLTPEVARALLRECVTVVQPGETLVVRTHDWWTPDMANEYQRCVDEDTESGRIPFKVVIVLGDELAIAKPEPDEDA